MDCNGMLNIIIEGVAAAIRQAFGSRYMIYTDEVKQGFKEPCFFILPISSGYTPFLNRRAQYRSRLDIHYFPSGFNKNADRAPERSPAAEPFSQSENADISDVSEKLYLVLEYIKTEWGLIRGTSISEERVDGVLHFMVDYSVVIRREKDKDPYMEVLNINETVGK